MVVRPDVVPAEFKTARQWAVELGVSVNTATRRINALVERKAWRGKKFRVHVTGDRAYPITHYAPANQNDGGETEWNKYDGLGGKA